MRSIGQFAKPSLAISSRQRWTSVPTEASSGWSGISSSTGLLPGGAVISCASNWVRDVTRVWPLIGTASKFVHEMHATVDTDPENQRQDDQIGGKSCGALEGLPRVLGFRSPAIVYTFFPRGILGRSVPHFPTP